MADNTQETSTPDYTMGYEDSAVERLSRFTAETDAAYLMAHLRPGMRLLDVGCGPGNISVGLASAVAPGEFHGIDTKGSQVELANTAANDGGHYNARFQVADALYLPFPDNHFDVVHCHTVLMHIPDTMAALAEIKRVLKEGGVLGAREPIVEKFFIEPDIGHLNKVWAIFSAVVVASGGHPDMGKELRARFSDSGFVNVVATGALETWGSPSETATFAEYFFRLDRTVVDQAVSHGIATKDEFDSLQEAKEVWKEDPGAFAAVAWGECLGRKP